MIKTAIVGAAGRMGRILIEALAEDTSSKLAAAIVSPRSNFIGIDAGELAGIPPLGIKTTDSLADCIEDIDAVIDFTLPDYTMINTALCANHKKNMVIGTTGFTDKQKQELHALAEKTAIVFAPNMSIGVNLVFKLLEMTAKVLDSDADIEVIEAHHRNKIDSPSGTALKMGEIVATATERDLKQCAIYGREGKTGIRDKNTIGFSTIRGGDIVGDHTVLFACDGERIEVTHKGSNRSIYARGAIRAVKFLQQKQTGLYDMQEVLGLH